MPQTRPDGPSIRSIYVAGLPSSTQHVENALPRTETSSPLAPARADGHFLPSLFRFRPCLDVWMEVRLAQTVCNFIQRNSRAWRPALFRHGVPRLQRHLEDRLRPALALRSATLRETGRASLRLPDSRSGSGRERACRQPQGPHNASGSRETTRSVLSKRSAVVTDGGSRAKGNGCRR